MALLKEKKELNASVDTSDPEEFSRRDELVEAKIRAYEDRAEQRREKQMRKKPKDEN